MQFEYERPGTVAQAIEMLADADGRATPITYGTDLLVWTKDGARAPGRVIDLSGIDELRVIEDADGTLAIGAAVSLAELGRHPATGRYPALREALLTMGSIQLREGASVGGNVCTASPAGDTGPPLLIHDATMVIAGKGGPREVSAADFYVGPGKCLLERGEVLLRLVLPHPPEGAAGVYRKGARRRAVDLALVSVAAMAWHDTEAASRAALRMALGAVAPTPIRARAAEELWEAEGLAVDPAQIAQAVRDDVKPIDDVRASAAYRRDLVGALAEGVTAALVEALSREDAK